MVQAQNLKERLEKAVVTLRALLQSAYTRPMTYRSAGPEMIRPSKTGAILHRGALSLQTNKCYITNCYNIIDALFELSDMQCALLWGWAMRVPWREFQQRYNRSRTHLTRLHAQALIALDQKLLTTNRSL